MSVPPDQAAFVYIGAFVEELARSGVRHACIAPGSRSTPLALTIARHPLLRVWMHLDERSAAYFAMGMARALQEPVALLCTSGTATANFLPAVVEARSAGVPLLVLTSDRPPELRDVGAAQTIDQNRLFGTHAKWFVEVALPDTTTELLRYVRTLAGRAVATARAEAPGPVHLNFPFREPLVPVAIEPPAGMSPAEEVAWNGRPGGEPWVSVGDGRTMPDETIVRRLARQLREAERPVLFCGPQADSKLAAPLAMLACVLRAPLLVDPLSQVRWGPHERSALIDRYDAALHHEPTAAALEPDLVMRMGSAPTSKSLLQYIQRHAVSRHVVVDASRWPDPTLLAAEVVRSDPRLLVTALLEQLESEGSAPSASSAWLERWRRVNAAAAAALGEYGDSVAEPFEGCALSEIAAAVPAGGTLFASSSMPVRDLDAFASGDERPIRVLANRGANGIDGVLSTALGVAAATSETSPLVLVLGDLAFIHDMNGLIAAKLHELDATIVVINNDGGGIFSFLPQSRDAEHFEQLFGTPHGLTFRSVAEFHGASYQLVSSHSGLRKVVAAGVDAGGLHIIELRTDRMRNVELHREARDAVFRALEARAGIGAGAE